MLVCMLGVFNCGPTKVKLCVKSWFVFSPQLSIWSSCFLLAYIFGYFSFRIYRVFVLPLLESLHVSRFSGHGAVLWNLFFSLPSLSSLPWYTFSIVLLVCPLCFTSLTYWKTVRRMYQLRSHVSQRITQVCCCVNVFLCVVGCTVGVRVCGHANSVFCGSSLHSASLFN